ncbi:MAG: hypothetical protein ACI9XO_001286 [Paraglaciecola sp.]|jgi:hypothetical protein
MLGGKPIRGDAKLYFDSGDFENSFCILIQEMKLNSEDTKDIVTALIKQLKLNEKSDKNCSI